jgi:hypothetical protein
MMKAFTRRAVTAAVGGVAMVGLAAGPAAAHFCYKSWETEASAAGKAGSSAWMSFEAIASMFLVDAAGDPLCLDGIQHLADAAGVELDTMVNTRGTMAGGKFEKDGVGNKAISHLDFVALDAATPDAYTMCDQTPPPPPA